MLLTLCPALAQTQVDPQQRGGRNRGATEQQPQAQR